MGRLHRYSILVVLLLCARSPAVCVAVPQYDLPVSTDECTRPAPLPLALERSMRFPQIVERSDRLGR